MWGKYFPGLNKMLFQHGRKNVTQKRKKQETVSHPVLGPRRNYGPSPLVIERLCPAAGRTYVDKVRINKLPSLAVPYIYSHTALTYKTAT